MTDDADPAADQPVLMLHRPEDSRYTLRFVSNDETRWRQKVLELAQSDDAEPWTDIQQVEGCDVYLVYARTTAEGVPFETESTEEIVDWLNTHFSQSDSNGCRTFSIASSGDRPSPRSVPNSSRDSSSRTHCRT